MSSFAFTDATVWIGGYDWTTDSNEITLNFSTEELDSTTFGGGGYRSRKAGLRSIEAGLKGFYQSAALDAPDPQAFLNLGTAGRVVTVAPDDAEATAAYMFQVGKFGFIPFGEIGALTPFELRMMGTDPVGAIRGQVAKAKGSVSATGALGSAVNLGAPSASQFVYATFHVFSAGTDITVDLESDTNGAFSSPTSRATIGPITTVGGTWMTRVPGAFSGETHWRLNVTDIDGTFQVAAAIAVQ